MASNRERLALLLERERRRAKGDLFTFARWMFRQRRGYPWQEARHHALICQALTSVFNGTSRRLVINVPPRYSKTELAVVNFIAWALGHVPDAEFIHASYSGTLASNNSANVRELVQHPAYGDIFPHTRISSDAKAHWTTTAGGVMYAAGAGGSITGFGAGKHRPGFGGAIIIDDPHKADEAGSDVIRQGVIDWFQNTVESRKNSPDTPIIVIMQRLHQKDLAGWLLGDRKPDSGPVVGGNGEVWDHLFLSAWNDDGTPLWPQKHSAEDLRRMESSAQYTFAGQYRQSPSPPAGGVIKSRMIGIVDAIPAGVVEWCRGWDLGATLDGDYTVGPKWGRLSDGRYVIADLVRDRLESDQRDRLMKNTADLDGAGVKQSIPQDPGQAGKSQVAAFAKLLAGHRVHFSPETGDKVTRADPMASQINAGNVVMLRAPWNDALVEEMALFPNGSYDDQVDGCARAFNGLVHPAAGIFA